MSISDEIREHVANGDLVPVLPRFGGLRVRRYMFMTRELNSEIENPTEGADSRFAELEADLVGFLVNRAIHKDYLKQLRPPTEGVWEIKCYLDEPAIRVFGQFATKNVFIAMTALYRADLAELIDPKWNYEIKRARSIWRNLFPAYDAKTSTVPSKLFDGAIHEKYYDN